MFTVSLWRRNQLKIDHFPYLKYVYFNHDTYYQVSQQVLATNLTKKISKFTNGEKIRESTLTLSSTYKNCILPDKAGFVRQFLSVSGCNGILTHVVRSLLRTQKQHFDLQVVVMFQFNTILLPQFRYTS